MAISPAVGQEANQRKIQPGRNVLMIQAALLLDPHPLIKCSPHMFNNCINIEIFFGHHNRLQL